MNHQNSIPVDLITQPTQHGLLVAWGHFAQSLDLLNALQQVAVKQKTVAHSPAAKLTTLLVGILSGMPHLTSLHAAAAPLTRDDEVARAWGIPALVEPSGVSRTLSACSADQLTQLQTVLQKLSQPFRDQALADLRARQQPFVLDLDLTGRPVSSTSSSYPAATFGYMDGQVRLGYQLAQVCLQTGLYGRQWLVAQQHSGDTVSASTVLALVAAAEAQLGCHPRRRTELLDQQIAAHQTTIDAWQAQGAAYSKQAQDYLRQRDQCAIQRQGLNLKIYNLRHKPVSPCQAGPYGALSRAERQLRYCELRREQLFKRYNKLHTQAGRYYWGVRYEQEMLKQLQERRAQLVADNNNGVDERRFILRMDAGFSSGDNLNALLELGYDLETKSANPALTQALLAKVTDPAQWQRVGKNAEMVSWTNYQLSTCRYPLTVGLERFHTPQGLKYAVLLRSQAAQSAPCPDLQEWFNSYNARQSIEAGFKQQKGVFQTQHLMSRHLIGMQIQVELSVFAANFVSWAQEWLRERMVGEQGQVAELLQSVKRQVQVGANSMAVVEYWAGQKVLRFSTSSSLAGILVRLAAQTAVQLALPLFGPPQPQRF